MDGWNVKAARGMLASTTPTDAPPPLFKLVSECGFLPVCYLNFCQSVHSIWMLNANRTGLLASAYICLFRTMC